MNKNIAGQTRKEYYEDHKDQILKSQNEYYGTHKEQRIEYQKKYNKTYYSEKFICDVCKKQMHINSKTKHLKTKLHQKARSLTVLEPEEEAPPSSS